MYSIRINHVIFYANIQSSMLKAVIRLPNVNTILNSGSEISIVSIA